MLRSFLSPIFLVCVLFGFAQKSFIQKNYYDQLETQLKEIITFDSKDSVPHGKYQSYFQNGSLESKGWYDHGHVDSLWFFYFQNGQQRAKGNFDMSKPNGYWEYFFENGQSKSKGYLLYNVQDGPWTYFYENGDEKSSGAYTNGLKTGIWNYFYEDNALKAQAFYEGGSGMYKEFYPSGSLKMEGVNENEESKGEWRYYYESGELEAVGNYQNGLRSGEWKYYHKNGELAATGDYSGGTRQGLWKYYYEDGHLSSEGVMKKDQKDGHWTLFYPSGEVKGEGTYDVGSGQYKEYYPSGKLRSIGSMDEGVKSGEWIYFDESGQEDGKAVFVNGIGNYVGYYEDGTIKMEGQIEEDKRIGDWKLYNPDGSLAGTYKPVYEEMKPIFRTGEIIKPETTRNPSEKPEYRFKNNKLRYFDPVINEYNGLIMGTNPLWTLAGQLPIAVEYYLQERLGHELEVTIHKDPFFKDIAKIDFFQVGTRGVSIALRQKFYQNDTNLGMFYFGHQVEAGFLSHQLTTEDSADVLITPVYTDYAANQDRFSYGLLIGNRWMERYNDSGLTVDIHLGIGFGKRNFQLEYEPTELTQGLFDDINQESFYIPIILGVNIGFAGPKRRSTSF